MGLFDSLLNLGKQFADPVEDTANFLMGKKPTIKSVQPEAFKATPKQTAPPTGSLFSSMSQSKVAAFKLPDLGTTQTSTPAIVKPVAPKPTEQTLPYKAGKFIAKTGVGVGELFAKTLDFVADNLQKNPPLGSQIGHDIGDKVLDQTEWGRNKNQEWYQALSQQKPEDSVFEKMKVSLKNLQDSPAFAPSKAYQEAPWDKKITDHFGETLFELGPSIVSSLGPYAINPALGLSLTIGSTAEDTKELGMKYGLSEDKAAGLGLATGVAIGALDKIFPDKLFGKEIKQPFIKGLVKRLAAGAIIEPTTEVTQEGVQLAAESVFRDDIKLNEVQARFAMSGLGGLLGGVGGTVAVDFTNALRDKLKPTTAQEAEPVTTQQMSEPEDVGTTSGIFSGLAQKSGVAFSLADKPGEIAMPTGSDKSLLAVHNLDERKLQFADKLGGLANPSLAIIDANKQGLEGYGDITLVGPKELIDPKTASKAKTYGADVYSPRHPSVTYKIPPSGKESVRKRLKPYEDLVNDKVDNIDFSDADRSLENSPIVMAEFLKLNGQEIPQVFEKDGKTVDEYYTRRAMRDLISSSDLQDNYSEHVSSILEDAGAQPEFFAGYTPSGSKKSLPATVENASKLMNKEEDRGGEGFFYGVGNVRAGVTPKFRNVTEIRKNKDKIVTTEEFTKVKEEMDNRFSEIRDMMEAYAIPMGLNPFSVSQYQAEAIGSYLKGDRSALQYQFKDIPQDALKKLDDFKKELEQMPTEYFETKFKRPVGINEFKYALVPDNASQKTLDILNKQGIEPIPYKAGDKTDKLAKLRELSAREAGPAFSIQQNLAKQHSFNMSRREAIDVLQGLIPDIDLKFRFGSKIEFADSSVSHDTGDGAILGYYDWAEQLIYLLQNGGNVRDKTVYHEAFHVYARNFLSRKDRVELYSEVNKKHKEEVKLYERHYSNEGDIPEEEWLADNFAKYISGKRKFFGKIKDFFDNLIAKIKEWMGQEDIIRKAFQDFESGKRKTYKNYEKPLPEERFSFSLAEEPPLPTEQIPKDTGLAPSKRADLEYRRALEAERMGAELTEKEMKILSAREGMLFPDSEQETGYQHFKRIAMRRPWMFDSATDSEVLKSRLPNVDVDSSFFEGAKEESNDELLEQFKKRIVKERELKQVAKQKTPTEQAALEKKAAGKVVKRATVKPEKQEVPTITISEKKALTERIKAESRGARWGFSAGSKEARARTIDILNHEGDKVDRLRAAIEDYVTSALPLEDRGEFLTSVRFSTTPEQALKIFERVDEYGSKQEAKRIDKKNKLTEDKIKARQAVVDARARAIGIFKLQSEQIDRLRKSVENYVVESLPPADRGKFLTAVRSVKTVEQGAKVFARIDQFVAKQNLNTAIAELSKTADKLSESKSVSADYRNKIKAIIDQYELSGHSQATLEKLSATQDFLDAAEKAGEDVEMPQRVLNKLKILARIPKDELSIEQVRALQAEIDLLGRLGKTKWNSKQELYNNEKMERKQELLDEATPINSSVSERGPIGSDPKKWTERYLAMRNYLQKSSVALKPIDGLADITGMNVMKDALDFDFNNYLTYNDKVFEKWYELTKDFKRENFERIGAVAAARQQGGMERLANSGITASEIDAINLTPEEESAYQFVRKSFEKEFPAVKKYALDVYNADVGQVDNYVSFMSDFDAMSDLEIYERFGQRGEDIGDVRTKTVEQGFTKERAKVSKIKLELNIDKIFRRHMDDTAYMLTMGRDIKMYSEIVNSPEMKEKLGDVGALAWLQWLDLMARKGGGDNAKRIATLDILRKNMGAGVLAFRLSSVLIQLTSFTDTLGTLGTEYATRGAASIATSKEWRDFIMDNFPEVSKAVGDDIAFREFGDDFLDKVVRAGFTPLQALDGLMRSTAAAGAYQKVAADRGEEVDLSNPDPEIIAEATKLMRQSQGSSFFKDQPLAITTGYGLTDNKSLNKTILTFQSFMLNRWDNMKRQIWRTGIKEKNYKKAGMSFLWMVIIAAVMEELLRRGSRELVDMVTGDEQEEKDFTKSVASNVAQTVPIMGSLVSALSYSANPVPVINTFEDILSGVGSVIGGKNLNTKLRGGVQAAGSVGTLMGIPGSSQAAQLVRKAIPQANEKKKGNSLGLPSLPKLKTKLPTLPKLKLKIKD